MICVPIVDNTFHDVPRSKLFCDIFVALSGSIPAGVLTFLGWEKSLRLQIKKAA